jgi:opacity protein-like surface antigen
MKTIKVCAFGLLFLSFVSITHAQEKWSAEIRPNANFATKDLGDAELKTGIGFEAAIGYRFMPHLDAYAGWGWNQFKSDTPVSFPGSDQADIEVTGYSFGLLFIHPIAETSTSYLIRIGGLYNHIEVENSGGDVVADSGHGLGWEFGAGLNLDLGNQWNLRPQVGYRSLSRDLEIGTATTEVDLNYVTVGVGIILRF